MEGVARLIPLMRQEKIGDTGETEGVVQVRRVVGPVGRW